MKMSPHNKLLQLALALPMAAALTIIMLAGAVLTQPETSGPSPSPWSLTEKLIGTARAGATGPGAYCSPAVNIVFVVDASGSMAWHANAQIAGLPRGHEDRITKWETAQKALLAIIDRHASSNYGLVLFCKNAWRAAEINVNNAEPIKRALENANLCGGTNLQAGFELAVEMLTEKLPHHPYSELESIIILITDGVPEDGDCRTAQCLSNLTGSYRSPGIMVDGTMRSVLTYAVGIGSAEDDDMDPDLLNAIASAGGSGSYVHADTLDELVETLDSMMATAPSVEVCDGYDNDCNGKIDEGLDPEPGSTRPEDQCITGLPGQCAHGLRQCRNGAWGCKPHQQAMLYDECNGEDNDCDGFIDGTDLNGDGILSPEESLRNLCGTCGPPPVEECNGRDDDCDGIIDNGAVCDEGLQCIGGICASPCESGECPGNMLCHEGHCVPPCGIVTCQGGEICEPSSGVCYDPCQGIRCPDNNCAGTGQCGSCYELGCPGSRLCVYPGLCKPNPCDSIQCEFHEYCLALPEELPPGHEPDTTRGIDYVTGECRPSCAAVDCAANATCIDGECFEDVCGGVTCYRANEICIEGECRPDPCLTARCNRGQICQPSMTTPAFAHEEPVPVALCLPNPCQAVHCRTGQACEVTCLGEECFARCAYEDLAVPPRTTPEPGSDVDDDPDGGAIDTTPDSDHQNDDNDGSMVAADKGCGCTIGAGRDGDGVTGTAWNGGAYLMMLILGTAGLLLRRKEKGNPS